MILQQVYMRGVTISAQAYYNNSKITGGFGGKAGGNNESKRRFTLNHYYFINNFTIYSRTKKAHSLS